MLHVGQIRLFERKNKFLEDIPHVLLLLDADLLLLVDPGLQGKEPRLVEGGRLNEYLGPVRVLLVHHFHVQLALLEVYVILFEVFSDDVLDFGEFLRVLRVHLNTLLVQLLSRLLHEPSYALYISLYCLVQTLFFLEDLILNVEPLLSEVIVRFLYLMQHTAF
jgi:hypothetical protein